MTYKILFNCFLLLAVAKNIVKKMYAFKVLIKFESNLQNVFLVTKSSDIH